MQTDFFSEFIPTVLATSRFWRLQKSFFTIHFIRPKDNFMFLNVKVIVSGNHSKHLFQPYLLTSHLCYECVQAHRSSLSLQLQRVHTMPRGVVEWSGDTLAWPISYLVFKLHKLYWWRMNFQPIFPIQSKILLCFNTFLDTLNLLSIICHKYMMHVKGSFHLLQQWWRSG